MNPRNGTRFRLVRGRLDFSFDRPLRGYLLGARVIILATPLDAAVSIIGTRSMRRQKGKRRVAIVGEARVMATELRMVTQKLITKGYPTIVLPMRLGIKHASSQRRRSKHFYSFYYPKHFAQAFASKKKRSAFSHLQAGVCV
jgi:hypothetical protein